MYSLNLFGPMTRIKYKQRKTKIDDLVSIMKRSILILAFLIVFTFVTINTDARRDKQSHITSLTIQFDRTDAVFILNYDFDKLSKMYLIMLGTKSLESKVKYMFSSFDYEIIKIDQDKAILKVKNISRFDDGYYLHDPHKFGETIGTVYIYSSDSFRPREYFNINSTPYYFYR